MSTSINIPDPLFSCEVEYRYADHGRAPIAATVCLCYNGSPVARHTYYKGQYPEWEMSEDYPEEELLIRDFTARVSVKLYNLLGEV